MGPDVLFELFLTPACNYRLLIVFLPAVRVEHLSALALSRFFGELPAWGPTHASKSSFSRFPHWLEPSFSRSFQAGFLRRPPDRLPKGVQVFRDPGFVPLSHGFLL